MELDIEEIARRANPRIRGWWQYYGKFYRSEMNRIALFLNWHLAKWAMRKYKRLNSVGKTRKWLERISRKEKFFVHWEMYALYVHA